jgi:hypothetical protein
MEAINLIDKEFSDLTCSIWVLERNKVGILGEFVYDNQEAVKLVRLRQSIHEIHGSTFLGL